jgi:hypothetical protein
MQRSIASLFEIDLTVSCLGHYRQHLPLPSDFQRLSRCRKSWPLARNIAAGAPPLSLPFLERQGGVFAVTHYANVVVQPASLYIHRDP